MDLEKVMKHMAVEDIKKIAVERFDVMNFTIISK